MTFAEKLKDARLKSGLSQEELAKRTGICARSLGSYERGERFPRGQAAISRLSDVLKVDLNYLISDSDRFVEEAGAVYGSRGVRQAKELLGELTMLMAGGEMAEEDMDEMMKAVQEAYWIAKSKNKKKYTPKKYLR